jgi:uncharacterized repeat protein (TIGR02543 family)
MKKIKYGLIFGSLIIGILAIASVILLASCNNLFDPPGDQPPAGYGRVTINITGDEAGRTTLPNIELFTLKYLFNDKEEQPQSGSSGSTKTFSLKPGTYKVDVEASDNGTIVAKGTFNSVTISDGSTTDVTVKLNPTVTTGQGKFDYNITAPTGADLNISLKKWPAPSSEEISDSSSGAAQISLDQGSYVLTVTVTDTAAGKYAGLVEAVHIYPNITTYFTHTFTELILEQKTYTVTFDKNGGDTEADPPTKTVKYPPKTNVGALPAAPELADNLFAGWNTDPDGNGIEFDGSTDVTTLAAPDNTLTVYAMWDPVADGYYVVTFNKNHNDTTDFNGPNPSTKQGNEDGLKDNSDLPTAPTRKGYKFAGWFTVDTETGGTEFTKDTPVSAAITVHARWTANKYTINFYNDIDVSEASPSRSIDVTYPTENLTTTQLAAPTSLKTNYEFDGWYNNKTGGTKYDDQTKIPTDTVPDATNNPIKLWGHWTHEVTFNLNYTSAPAPTTVTVSFNETTATVPATPTRSDGYTFDGWYDAATGGNKITVTSGKIPISTTTKTTTAYAQWTKDKTPVTLSTVVADSNTTALTTTKLTLTFNTAIAGLQKSYITVLGKDGYNNFTPGNLTGTGTTWDLAIDDVTDSGTVTVTVASFGDYTITGSPKEVNILFVDTDTRDAFDKAVAIKDVAVAATGLVTVDTETGIIARTDTTADQYGNYFSVKIPTTQLTPPILACDTIIISYIGRSADKSGQIPITPKTKGAYDGGTDNLVSGGYPNFNGNLTVSTHSINASEYGSLIPTDVLWFQSRPPSQTWELKILNITVTRGDPIKANLPIAIKPVSGAAPVTTLPENLQYEGNVSWTPTVTSTFAADTSYTASISLTAKPGYTFDGITANTFPVNNASSVSHVTGTTTTLSISAVFPETAPPAPAKLITFTADDLTAIKGITADEVTTDSFTMTTTGGWGNVGNYAYIEVDFGTYKLGDYKKVDLTFEQLSGDMGYKAARVWAFDTEPTSSISDSGDNRLGTTENNSSDGIGPKTATLTFTTATSINLKTVYIAFGLWTDTGAKFKISDIRFHNDAD